MVDFKKRLGGKSAIKLADPIQLYETLDRAHDKGPLRPAQAAVLDLWQTEGIKKRDVILKLHTGQGKTLVGLLMLQSRLNAAKGSAVFLCPNNFLIEQTCEQAKQFGIHTCVADPELPESFLNGERILVTSVQKLFNGLTKFGLNRNSIPLGTILMDDAHACVDAIREACQIKIPKDDSAYASLITLFADDLERQGVGTFADILNGNKDALLPVPYWAWIDRESEVAAILSAASKRPSVRFTWPLLKNVLVNCQCVVSGDAIEIEPYVPPLDAFGSFWKADHRIFMSATVTDDAFLIKGLQLLPDTIINPLIYAKERWSGEKMILLPSIIHEELSRQEMVHLFARPFEKRRSGVVAITPSFARTADWESYKAVVATRETLARIVDGLKKGDYEKTVVLVNRYDGIDLPDDTCRVLVFDSKPHSESLIDIYQESCREDSDATLMRTIRTVEQGMGRSVRGEKDYSVILVVGADITRLLREKRSRAYLSSQMSTQIEIGLEIAELAKEDIAAGKKPMDALNDLIGQCLNRDDGWKAFYSEQMDDVKPSGANKELLEMYRAELEAEQAHAYGDSIAATKILQKALDKGISTSSDKAWYLQSIARFNYKSNRAEFERMQIAAHQNNRLLLRPPSGTAIAKLTSLSQGRMERIAIWIKAHGDYSQLDVFLSDILNKLVFGVKADKFEHALNELGKALGFSSERPDKEWKEGPDNLWALDDTNYIVWECKNEVDINRAEINKREAEQMNRSAAWFEKHYAGCKAKHVIVHPTSTVASAASFIYPTEAMRENELRRLAKAVRAFFKSFESINFNDLSLPHIQNLINANALSTENLLSDAYVKKLLNLR